MSQNQPPQDDTESFENPSSEQAEFSEKEQKLFDLLDRYVASLHGSDINTRSGIMQHHPELAELLRCLDSLDILAPGAADGNKDRPGDDSEELKKESGAAFQEFGKYELLEEIGRGGMGVVYRARQRDLDRVVALKMILSSRLASREDVSRFYLEARAAGSLRHSNIVGIHEVGEINGQHYFAMDYVDGESLAELLQDGPIDVESATQCLSSVARAVDYLHKNHIVHRDLKPSNILIDPDGTPYVTDFGLAKIFDSDSSMTQTGAIVGTPSYMAPEQAAGRNTEISPQCDIYSLGAILYELLTGRPPFKRDNPLDTLVEVLEGEPTLPRTLNRSIPRELELICLQCLQKDPAKRYASAVDLADDLDHYLKREPISARPSNVWQQLRRWGRREPALVTRGLALLVASGIVQIKYMIDGFDFEYHVKIMSLFGIWAVVAFVFQRFLNRESTASFARFSWAAADIGLLTTMLSISDPPLGALLIGYPLLVAASGLFFRVRLVFFTTAVAMVAYSLLTFLKPEIPAAPAHYPVIFVAVLAVLGCMVGYQVYRIRVLSRFFEHRQNF